MRRWVLIAAIFYAVLSIAFDRAYATVVLSMTDARTHLCKANTCGIGDVTITLAAAPATVSDFDPTFVSHAGSTQCCRDDPGDE